MVGALGKSQKIGKRAGSLGNKRTIRDHTNNTTIKIIQNTEKSPGNLKRLPVAQTSVRNRQLTLAEKILKGVK